MSIAIAPTTQTFPQNSKPRRLPLSTSTPKTAFEKATFRLNANTSPLLRLPSELRNRVWSLVLGERVLHVWREFRYRAIEDGRLKAEREDAFQGRECGCPFTEKGLFENYMACLKTLGELEMETEADGGGEELDGDAFNLDFSTLENPDVLENFDFDAFLNQSGGGEFHVEGFGAELAFDAGGEGEVNGRTEMGLDPGGLTGDQSHHQDQEQIFNLDFGTTEYFDFDAFPNQDREDSRWTHELPDHYFAGGNVLALPDSLATLRPRHRKRALLDALDSIPHSACFPGTQSRQPRSELSLQILRSCRQIYDEANAIFWSSNTFSFSSPDDLTRFMKARSLFTRAMITKVHLDVVSQEILAGWSQSFRKWLVASLRGLRVLHIHVSAAYLRSHRCFVDELLDTFTPFCWLGLRDVTVVIPFSRTKGLNDLPADDCVESVERVRGRLMGLVPVGAV